MKNRLLFIFGTLLCWFSSYGQAPEYLYYKFDDSAIVKNYASDPQGHQNIPVPSNLHIDTVGFQGSNSLSGNSDPAGGGLETGFYPDYSKSFTIAFWYSNDWTGDMKCFYLFGDSLAGFHCIYTASGPLGQVSVYGKGGLQNHVTMLNNPGQGGMLHLVYDATPTVAGPYGTYTMYSNGVNLFGPYGEIPIVSPPYNVSSGLSIGSAPLNINLIGGGCDDTREDMGGNLDEFRWYNRALTSAEILNTFSSDVRPLGVCSPYTSFKIDSISGEFARVNWTPGIGNDAFFLEYGPSGFSRGSGTLISGSYGVTQSPVELNGLTAGTQYDVYFGEYCNGGADSVYNPYPLTFKTTPLCPTPVNIELTSGIDWIEIKWDHTGPVEKYYIVYGPSGFDPLTAGLRDSSSLLPYELEGLQPGTRYDVYIETGCGATLGKSILVKRSIVTDCEIKTAPYFEDFNDSTWAPVDPVYGRDDTVNVCWSRQDDHSYYFWKVMEGSHKGPLSGRGGSGKFLGTPDLGYYGKRMEIYSPLISVQNLSQPYLSFYYHRCYYEYQRNIEYAQPDFKVEINDGSGWKEVIRLERYAQPNQDDPYQKIGADISSFGDTVQIRLVASSVSNGLAAVMGFDDLSVDEAPACPEVYDVSVESYGADTSLVLNINSNSTSYEIEWAPGEFDQGTGCTKVTSAPVILDDCVNPDMNVNLYIKECDAATWAGPFELCGPYTAPYYTGFSGEDTLSKEVPCWDIYSSGKGAGGDGLHSENDRTRSFAGSNAMRLHNYYQESDDTLLAITPAFIDLPEGGRQIRFMAFYAEGTPLDNNHLVVGTISDVSEGSTFKPIDTLHLKKEWKEYVVNLDPSASPYNGIDNRIALKTGKGIKRLYIDDFYYEQTPSCPAPLKGSLSVRDEWYDAVTVMWEKYSGAQSKVSWGVPGYNPGSSSEMGNALVSATSYRINDLSPNTTYEFYVQANCGATDESEWMGPYTFRTICTPFTAPFSESFDGNSWVPAPHDFGLGALGLLLYNQLNIEDILDPCWRRNIITGKERTTGLANLSNIYHAWGVTQQSVYKVSEVVVSGPLTDHSDTGNYIFPVPRAGIDLGDNVPDTADIYLPLLDISPLSKPYMSFFYHRYTAENYMPDVLIQANDGSGWLTLDILKGIQQSSATDPFYQRGISLAGLRDTVRIRFRSLFIGAPDAERSIYANNGVSAIDEIEIKEAPPCLEPFDLAASQEIDTSAGRWNMSLSWSNSNISVNGFEVTYGIPGSDPDSLAASGIIFSSADTSLLLDTLSAGCYEFFVRSLCVSGDTSDFSPPQKLCVNCRPLKAPLLETFNQVDLYTDNMLPCWDRKFAGNNPSLSYSWEMGEALGNFRNTGPQKDIDGEGLYAYINCLSSDGDTAVLYSPMVDISDLGKPEMSFAYHMFGLDIDTLHVDIFDGHQWYENVVEIAGEQQSTATDPWLDTVVKLDNYSSTDMVQVRFWTVRTGYFGMIALDNFRISDTMSCPFPLAFRMQGNTDSTAVLKWESQGNAQNFIVEYGLLGYEYGQGTKIVVSSDSAVIPVADNRLYEAYVKSDCGGGDSSLVSGPVSFQSGVVPCDDMEQYIVGSLTGQSAYIKSWSASPPYFNASGLEQFSNQTAKSGQMSIYMTEDTAQEIGSNILAEWPEISNGLFKIDFAFNMIDNGGGYYQLVSALGDDGNPTDGMGGQYRYYLNNIGSRLEIYTMNGVLVDTVPYIRDGQGWASMSHIVDLVNDTSWVLANEINPQVGYGNLGPGEPYLRLTGLYFLTTPSNLNFDGFGSEFYIDDICVTPYECPEPSQLTLENTTCATASLRWTAGQEGSEANLEYGVSGFARGSGDTVRQTSDNYRLTGLTPGETYDVYIEEVCGLDTVFTGPMTFTLPTEAIADFTYTQGNPTLSALEVSFDGSTSVAAEGYIWDFGDGSTANDVAPKHTYTANGTYNVQLIIESDCGNDTISKIIEISGIGLAENILEESLEIYPNPFTDKVLINFETQNSEDAFLQLSDLSGKIILEQSLKDGNGVFAEKLELGHLAKGTYLLKVSSGDVNAVRRIVKE